VRPIRLIKQDKKNNCGQTCAAMIMERPIDQITTKIGKTGKTSAKDLFKALDYERYLHTDKLQKMRPEHYLSLKESNYTSSIYLCRIKNTDKSSHWIVMHGHHIYDPAYPYTWEIKEYFRLLDRCGRKLTSYVIVLPPNGH
jgi:hypothetical protein